MKIQSISKHFHYMTLAAALVAGCSAADMDPAPPGDEPAEQAESPQAAAEEGREGPRFRGRHAMRGLPPLFHAALDLELSDAQRASIENIVAELKPNKGDKHAMIEQMRTFDKALADGVRAGNLDDGAIAAQAKAVTEAHQTKHAQMGEALVKLHGVLDAQQRATLVSSVKSAMGEMRGHKGNRGGHKAKMGKKHMAGKHNPAMWMLRGIDLSDEQHEQVSAAIEALGKPDFKQAMEQHKAQMEAFLTAFASDSFDASSLPQKKDGASMLDGKVKLLKAVVPILDETQRAQLADRLEKGMRHHKDWRGRHRGKHRGSPAAGEEI